MIRSALLLCLLAVCTAPEAAAGDSLADAPQRDPGLRPLPTLLRGEARVDLAEALVRSGLLTGVAAKVNPKLRLGARIGLRLVECGAPNAFYLPDEREIHLCLELAELVAQRLADQVDDEEQLLQAVDGTLRFILLHEVGHALVDVLSLPITGREEDAVDQLSVWLLLQGRDGESAVLSAAAVFASQLGNGDDFAAAHSLDSQRYFNMLCWVYGSNPGRHADLPEDWGLPASRSAGCPEEFAQLDRSWRRLLAAHLRPPTASRTVADEAVPVKREDPDVPAPAESR